LGGILGGMAFERDSEMLQRLQSHYGEMSDGELLAVNPEDLTDLAAEVLRGERSRRGLKAEAPPEGSMGSRWGSQERTQEAWPKSAGAVTRSDMPAVIMGSQPTLDMAQPENSGVGARESLLGSFHDAIEVGRACEFLEANEVPFRIEDVAKPRSGIGVYDSPPVALNLIVGKADRERAMAILRQKMGLFPLQEVEEADAAVDDGTVATLGDFGRREDADGVGRILDDARIWHRITANPEGTVENEDCYTLVVREIDLVKAGDVVEKAMR
jgi:hypothetical protein